jgi:hypothetical protein
MKEENQSEKRSFGKKKTKGEKVGPIDAHGGVRHKKGMNQARSESKSPVCVCAHTAYVGWCTGGAPRSHLIVQCTVTTATMSITSSPDPKETRPQLFGFF